MSEAKTSEPLQPGDLCHHGDNSYPLYEVIHVRDGHAWLRDVSSGVEGLVSVHRCLPVNYARAEQLDADLRRAAQLDPAPPQSKLAYAPRD
jgi:hypothetical protein